MQALTTLQRQILRCTRCPRLVEYRTRVAREKRRQYRQEDYWGKPVPSFGDLQARLLVIGLAPAAHGGNRTGRVFTGDRSGDWLYGALHAAGFANQPDSKHSDDGLKLNNCYITAAVHCAPPGNKPSLIEFKRCRPYLIQELILFRRLRVVIVLGKIAFDSFLAAYHANGGLLPKPRPKFGHGISLDFPDGLRLICSYHPSQQNTFTGKLTKSMFQQLFNEARRLSDRSMKGERGRRGE